MSILLGARRTRPKEAREPPKCDRRPGWFNDQQDFSRKCMAGYDEMTPEERRKWQEEHDGPTDY